MAIWEEGNEKCQSPMNRFSCSSMGRPEHRILGVMAVHTFFGAGLVLQFGREALVEAMVMFGEGRYEGTQPWDERDGSVNVTDQVESEETGRLETLWAGEFGDAYLDRNRTAGENRGPFWQSVLVEYPARRVLEVGCNVGGNLRWIAQHVPPHEVFGIDVNQNALVLLRHRVPGVNVLWGRARDLPFRDKCFDLVFTTGVLIHQPQEALPRVMAEIVRCSRRYILCGEYFADQPTEVPYRGQKGALFKRDFGGLYQQLFPGLPLVKTGFLPREHGGWDDVTYWIFDKLQEEGTVGRRT